MKNKNQKIVYQGKMIEIVNEYFQKNGKEIILEHGRRAPGVRLIIETPSGNLLISKEERFKIGTDYRLPGGKVFDSLREYNQFLAEPENSEKMLEKIREAVKKEAMEEIGINPTDFGLFFISHCGGSFEWDLYYFIVKKYEKVSQQLEEHEEIEVIEVSPNQIKELAFSGAMKEDRSVAVILKYLH